MSRIGTQYKVTIHIDSVGGVSMIDNLVSATFFTARCPRGLELFAKDIRRRDEENAVFVVDSALLQPGNLLCTVTVHIPDEDAPKGYRVHVETVYTGIFIEP